MDSREIAARICAALVGAVLALAGAGKVMSWNQWRANAHQQHLWSFGRTPAAGAGSWGCIAGVEARRHRSWARNVVVSRVHIVLGSTSDDEVTGAVRMFWSPCEPAAVMARCVA